MSDMDGGRLEVAADQHEKLVARDVLDALQHIDPDRRTALMLVAVEGFSYAEAAGILDVPAGTLMSRIARGAGRTSQRAGGHHAFEVDQGGGMTTKRTFSDTDLHLALDNEMPPELRSEFDRWLSENPQEKARFDRYLADRDALKNALDPILDEAVPASLSQIGASANDSSKTRSRWQMAAAAVLLFAAGGVTGYLAGTQPAGQPDGGSLLAGNAIAAHVVYAAEKRHTVEVGVDEKDHLIAWLSKRVGLSLVAPDLESYGYSLVGGRLLPSDDRTAAQFMYENTSRRPDFALCDDCR